jgi:hypothetical protein
MPVLRLRAFGATLRTNGKGVLAGLLIAACSGGSGGSKPPAHACGEPGGAWQRCAGNPVVRGWRDGPGPGQHLWTMADPTVLYDQEEGRWKAWWSSVVAESCADVGVLDRRAIEIFYAESEDGLAWALQAEPALASKRDPDNWDDTTSETPAVLKVPDAPPDRRYVLVYGGGNDRQLMVDGNTGWQLGIAFSADGRHFTRLPAADSPYAGQPTPFTKIDGLLLLGQDLFTGFDGTAPVAGGAAADPELVRVGDTYHLWAGALGVDAAGAPVVNASYTRLAYGIVHATSTDLLHWTVTPGENPVLMGAGQATVVRDEAAGQLHLWYSLDQGSDLEGIPSALFPTRGFFHATSAEVDGAAWATDPVREFTWDPGLATEALGLINGPEVVRSGDEYRLYFGAWGTAGVPAGSCAYVWQGGALTAVDGVFGLGLATRRAP